MDIEREILELKNRVAYLESVLKIRETEMVSATSDQKRDKTKFLFDNKIYAKNRFVLAVIKRYIDETNPTFAELESIFNKSLQGSLNVVLPLDEANKIKDAAKRYFMDDVLELKDGAKVVVCTQWGIFNVANIERLAKKLGYEVERV